MVLTSGRPAVTFFRHAILRCPGGHTVARASAVNGLNDMLQKEQSLAHIREYRQMTYLLKSHSISRSDNANGDFQ